MRIPLSKTCLAMLLSLLFAAPSQLWGWGGTGHEAVAYVAWQKMTPATRARAIALLALVPSLTSPQNKSVPGYSDWIKDLPSDLGSVCRLAANDTRYARPGDRIVSPRAQLDQPTKQIRSGLFRLDQGFAVRSLAGRQESLSLHESGHLAGHHQTRRLP